MRLFLVASLVSLIAGCYATGAEQGGAQQDSGETPSAWEKEWAVEEGFSLSIDTEGYHYPTAIAFVPTPGPGPKDPLYFVTELRGKVKVVTNDRTVYTFAEDFLQTEFYAEKPKQAAEFGLVGICLEPSRGYVFVTFAYQDERKILRNNIMRFETTPGTFALKPESRQAFTEVFVPYESGVSHQIGGCQISEDMLYVGVGDGYNLPLSSQRLDTFRGKLLRMTLDGKPVADNPFYKNNDIQKAANYVWAYGLRNPFSLKIVDGNVMMAGNGVNADQFLKAQAGKNYLWDGNDQSIAANADYVFLQAVGPTQMDYYRRTSPAFPDRLREQFYVAASGTPAGIIRIPYDLEESRVSGVVEYVMKNTAPGGTVPGLGLTGLAFGPDGLYFSPIMPVRNGQGAVLKLKYEPQAAHPTTLAELESSEIAAGDSGSIKRFMHRKGCFGCHKLKDEFERGGTKGPVLDVGNGPMIERIRQRVSSPEFLEYLQGLDARDQAPYNRYEEARDQVAQAQGRERVRIWMKYQILEPRFDGPSTMPNLGLNETEAEAIMNYLMGGGEDEGLLHKLREMLSEREVRRLAAGAFAVGFLVALPVWFALWWFARTRSRKRHV